MPQETNSALLLAGQVYIATYGDGDVVGNLTGPFEVDQLELTPGSDTKELLSRRPGMYGQVRATVQIPKSTDLAISFGSVDRVTLTMALLGSQVLKSQASGDVVNQNLTVTEKGVWFELGKKDISAVVVKNDYNDVTYVAGVDYEVNERMGLISIPEGSVISATPKPDGSHHVIHVSYHHAASSDVEIAGSVVNQVKARIVFDGVNLVDQRPVNVEIDQAVLAPSGGFDVMASDFSKVPLKGKVVTVAGKSEPYRVRLSN